MQGISFCLLSEQMDQDPGQHQLPVSVYASGSFSSSYQVLAEVVTNYYKALSPSVLHFMLSTPHTFYPVHALYVVHTHVIPGQHEKSMILSLTSGTIS